MYDRLFKNWKTTLLGILIILAGLTLVFFEKATLTEATPFLIGVYAVIYKRKTKDEGKGKEEG